MKEKYSKQGLRVVSVHTPEFPFEKERSRVEGAVKRFKLTQPVYMDNDYAYWKALKNRYWPAFYLVDKQGRIRMSKVGEMHSGSQRAKEMQQTIEKLLQKTG